MTSKTNSPQSSAYPPQFKSVLQWSNLIAAFDRVRKSEGGPGVDRETVFDFERNRDIALTNLKNELLDGSYAPLPLLKILVEKKNGEARGLSIPAVRDRIAQAALLNIVEPVFEAEFEACSFAYRKGRSVRQAVSMVLGYYEKGYRWVVDADIDAFFDCVDHQIMMQKVDNLIEDGQIRRLIQMWIQAEVWDGEQVSRLSEGIPQGSVISPILANLFLDELDDTLKAQGYKPVRFSDDFLILCKTKTRASEALAFTEAVLKKMSLVLDEADVVHFDQGFTFLGVTFVKSMVMVPYHPTKKKKSVLYYPPPLNLAAYLLKRKQGW